MKRLDKCVNIIPVIAKSDTLTLEEREAFKRRVSLVNIYSKFLGVGHSQWFIIIDKVSGTGCSNVAQRLNSDFSNHLKSFKSSFKVKVATNRRVPFLYIF